MKGRFVQFDICEFYPSISEELFRSSLDYAKTYTGIDEEKMDYVMACRRSVLFSNDKTWTKKGKDFDVTMGSQDGAKIAELNCIYLLKQVQDLLASLDGKAHTGLLAQSYDVDF